MNSPGNSTLSHTEFVVDASALLAWTQDEIGGDTVEELIDRLIISTVNWIEVAQKAFAQDVNAALLRSRLERRGLLFAELTIEDAEIAAELRSMTQYAGLSLGDRACLALSVRLGIPALTADRAWSNVDLDIEIVQIR